MFEYILFHFICLVSLLEFKLSWPWLSTPLTAVPQYYSWAYFTKLPNGQQHYVQLGYTACNSREAITWKVWIEINLLPYWKHGYHCTNFCKTNNLSTNSVHSSYIEFYPDHKKMQRRGKHFIYALTQTVAFTVPTIIKLRTAQSHYTDILLQRNSPKLVKKYSM